MQCGGHRGSVGSDRVETGTAMRKDCKHPGGTHDGGLVCVLAFCYCHRNAQDNQLIKRLARCGGIRL